MAPPIQYASFLIRLWREVDSDQQDAPADWQGEIEHIQTGDRWAFGTLNKLLDILRREAADPERMQLPPASQVGSVKEHPQR